MMLVKSLGDKLYHGQDLGALYSHFEQAVSISTSEAMKLSFIHIFSAFVSLLCNLKKKKNEKTSILYGCQKKLIPPSATDRQG